MAFVTLRHWRGMMEHHRTGDILHVKGILATRTYGALWFTSTRKGLFSKYPETQSSK